MDYNPKTIDFCVFIGTKVLHLNINQLHPLSFIPKRLSKFLFHYSVFMIRLFYAAYYYYVFIREGFTMQIKLQSDNYHVLLNTLGAELNSYSNPSGKEYVWNSDPAYWLRSSPLLFPTVGNVRNGETVIKNHIYQMPKHGFCKESEFEVTEQTENSVTFLLKANEETLKLYPYNFELYLSYHLNGSALSMDYKVINKDSDLMYYHIGAHPGLCVRSIMEKILRIVFLDLKKKKISFLTSMI